MLDKTTQPGCFIFCYISTILFTHSVLAVAQDATEYFLLGQGYYEQQYYADAVSVLEQAVQLAPDRSAYHYLLAKSYGRQAEQVNFIKAMLFARKTLQHLELATELDSTNIDILQSLADYYGQAPAFLGGNKKKQQAIHQKIQDIQDSLP